MEAAFKAAHEWYEEEAGKNPTFKTLYEPWKKLRSEEYQWFRIAEATFANFIGMYNWFAASRSASLCSASRGRHQNGWIFSLLLPVGASLLAIRSGRR